ARRDQENRKPRERWNSADAHTHFSRWGMKSVCSAPSMIVRRSPRHKRLRGVQFRGAAKKGLAASVRPDYDYFVHGLNQNREQEEHPGQLPGRGTLRPRPPVASATRRNRRL